MFSFIVSSMLLDQDSHIQKKYESIMVLWALNYRPYRQYKTQLKSHS